MHGLKDFADFFYQIGTSRSGLIRGRRKGFVIKVSEIFQAMHKDGTLTKLSMKWFGFEVTKKAK